MGSIRVLCVALTLLTLTHDVGAYDFTPITVPFPDVSATNALGISNGKSKIVGSYSALHRGFGFLRKPNGRFVKIKVRRAMITVAWGINDAGQIVGHYSGKDDVTHGFLRQHDRSIITIDVPSAFSTAAYGINNLGQIVGATSNHGFLREPDGSFTHDRRPVSSGTQGTAAYGIQRGRPNRRFLRRRFYRSEAWLPSGHGRLVHDHRCSFPRGHADYGIWNQRGGANRGRVLGWKHDLRVPSQSRRLILQDPIPAGQQHDCDRH